jgi:hypothetical protein
MHPTADTRDFMYINLAGQRVMPGVRRFLPPQSEQEEDVIIL